MTGQDVPGTCNIGPERFCANYGFRGLYNFEAAARSSLSPAPRPSKRTAGGLSRSPRPRPPSGSGWR